MFKELSKELIGILLLSNAKNEAIWILCIKKSHFLVKKIISDTEEVIETKDKFLQDMHKIIVGNNHTENKKKTSLLVNKF